MFSFCIGCNTYYLHSLYQVRSSILILTVDEMNHAQPRNALPSTVAANVTVRTLSTRPIRLVLSTITWLGGGGQLVNPGSSQSL